MTLTWNIVMVAHKKAKTGINKHKQIVTLVSAM